MSWENSFRCCNWFSVTIRYQRMAVMAIKNASSVPQIQKRHLKSCVSLTLVDSAGRANTCTGTAGDASVSVDNVLAVSLGNSAYRALALAGTATNTRIRNYICHDNILLKYSIIISIASLYTKSKKYSRGKYCTFE